VCVEYPPALPVLDAISVLLVVGLFREDVAPVAGLALSPFLVVLVAIMERRHRSLVDVAINPVPAF